MQDFVPFPSSALQGRGDHALLVGINHRIQNTLLVGAGGYSSARAFSTSEFGETHVYARHRAVALAAEGTIHTRLIGGGIDAFAAIGHSSVRQYGVAVSFQAGWFAPSR
jgi:shikimate 5-dehydrogenase